MRQSVLLCGNEGGLFAQDVGEQETRGVFDAVKMRALNAVAGVNAHTKEGGAKVVAAAHGLACIGAVAVKEINGIVTADALCRFNQAIG